MIQRKGYINDVISTTTKTLRTTEAFKALIWLITAAFGRPEEKRKEKKWREKKRTEEKRREKKRYSYVMEIKSVLVAIGSQAQYSKQLPTTYRLE